MTTPCDEALAQDEFRHLARISEPSWGGSTTLPLQALTLTLSTSARRSGWTFGDASVAARLYSALVVMAAASVVALVTAA